jgi:hypothetical protein
LGILLAACDLPLVAASAEEILLFLLEGLLNEIAEPEVGQMGEQLGALFYSTGERVVYLFTEHVGW